MFYTKKGETSVAIFVMMIWYALSIITFSILFFDKTNRRLTLKSEVDTGACFR